MVTSERLREETRGFVRRGDWEKASPEHLLDLYEALHRQIYGVEAEDLDFRTRPRARGVVRRVIEGSFAGDLREVAEFLDWLWRREQGREEWRRENHRDGGRMSWQVAFGRAAITDYRVAKARRKG